MKFYVLQNSMDGPRGYYAKQNKPDIEKQVPYDLTYMWYLNKTKKQKETDSQIQRIDWELTEGGRLRGWVRKMKVLRNRNW